MTVVEDGAAQRRSFVYSKGDQFFHELVRHGHLLAVHVTVGEQARFWSRHEIHGPATAELFPVQRRPFPPEYYEKLWPFGAIVPTVPGQKLQPFGEEGVRVVPPRYRLLKPSYSGVVPWCPRREVRGQPTPIDGSRLFCVVLEVALGHSRRIRVP